MTTMLIQFLFLPVVAFANFGAPAPRCAPFLCPSGEKSMRKKGHKTWSYGCPDSGTNFLSMLNLNANDPLAGLNKNKRNFNKCCLEQDACLQTCGMSSEACHDAYYKCTAKICKGDKNCGIEAEMAKLMNSPFLPDKTQDDEDTPGCSTYSRWQNESCECVPEQDFEATFEKRLKTFYKLYNKEKLGSNGEIKDLEQVKTKWSGKEPEMFLELTKKYKDKAIDKRTKPKNRPGDDGFRPDLELPNHIPSQPDAQPDVSVEDVSGFKARLKQMKEEQAKAVQEENYDLAADWVDKIKALTTEEAKRLRDEKKQAIADEDYQKAKMLKKEIEALDPRDEL